MSRVYNFNPGPSTLPVSVLERAREDMLDWSGQGMSVMEVSHRSKAFIALAAQTEARLRRLLDVPDDYKVLFLQGGAQLQFAAVAMNLTKAGDKVDYVDTGAWSSKAIKEAERFCRVNIAASAKASGYNHIPPEKDWRRSKNSIYLHYCPNETIGGVEFHFVPQSEGVPLVADFSSTILSRPIDVSRFGLIYAGAQKNAGISGLTIVIVHEDLLDRARPDTPSVMNYKAQAESDSMLNTVPTFAWYITALVLEWIESQGGVTYMAQRNQRKADALYACIEASNFYASPVAGDCRSWMNVPFTLADPRLDQAFLDGAQAAGLAGLKGHRSVGGMRASLYNALPEAAVDALTDYMREFERERA